jgi:hypothetical protein
MYQAKGGIGAAPLQACAELTFAHIRNPKSGGYAKTDIHTDAGINASTRRGSPRERRLIIAFSRGLLGENLSEAHSNRRQAKIITSIGEDLDTVFGSMYPLSQAKSSMVLWRQPQPARREPYRQRLFRGRANAETIAIAPRVATRCCPVWRSRGPGKFPAYPIRHSACRLRSRLRYRSQLPRIRISECNSIARSHATITFHPAPYWAHWAYIGIQTTGMNPPK